MSKITTVVSASMIVLLCTSQAEEKTVQDKTLATQLNARASITLVDSPDTPIELTVDRKVTPQGEQITAVWQNNTGKPAVIKNAMFHIGLAKPIEPDMSVMAGISSMGGRTGVFHPAKDNKGNPSSHNYMLVRYAPDDYLLLAATTWNTFLCDLRLGNGGGLEIKVRGDQKQIDAGATQRLETFILLRGSHWADLLEAYAKRLAAMPRARKPKLDKNWVGWSCWTYYTRLIRHEDVVHNTLELKKMAKQYDLQPNIVQIDGGWWPLRGRGDYLTAKDDFPGGIGGAFKEAKKAGYTAALHLDAFRADSASQVFKDHPDWFLRNKNGKIMTKENTDQPYGPPLGYAWFDFSHPEVRQYFTKVLKYLHEDCGIDFFKLDFLNHGIFPGFRGHGYVSGITALERFRMAMKTFHEAVPDAHILGCSAYFGPSMGYVDALRTGGDINARDYHWMVQQVANNAASAYLHNIAVNIDSDFIVLRTPEEQDDDLTPSAAQRSRLTHAQANVWATFAALCGNMRLDSDKLSLLNATSKETFQRICKLPFMKRLVPLDMWQRYRGSTQSPRVFLTTDGRTTYLSLFNYGGRELSFNIAGLDDSDSLVEFYKGKAYTPTDGQFRYRLTGTSCIVFKYQGEKTYKELLHTLNASAD